MANDKDMVQAAGSETVQSTSEKFTLEYVLTRIEKIREQTDYLHETIQALADVRSVGPGDIGAEEKAKALGDVVKSRETTNQQLLRMYEKMYEDLKPQKSLNAESLLETVQVLFENCDEDTVEERAGALDTLRQILKENRV